MSNSISPRVLCMEDDRATARLLKKWLERTGYLVDLACDGAEGLAKCRAQAYDALLVDQQMPDLDGLEVVGALAAEGRLPPTILVTAGGNEAVAMRAMRLGVADYILKDSQGEFLGQVTAALTRVLEVQQLRAEKKAAEESLRRMHSELQQVFNAAVPICVIDREGVIIRVNASFCTTFDAEADHLLGRRCRDLWEGPHCQSSGCPIHRLADGDQCVRYEVRRKMDDGAPVTYLLRATPFRDAHGELVGSVVSLADITDRKRTELELERRTRALALHVKHIKCLHAISRLLENEGLTLPEILRRAVALIPSAWQHSDVACARIILDDLVFATDHFAETLWKQAAPLFVEGQFAGAVELCYLECDPGDGEPPFLEEERALIEDIGERLSKVIERHRAQAKVRALQQQIEYVLGATKTGLCITDAQLRLQYVDRTWQQVYGDPAGKTCYEYFKGAAAPCDGCGTVEALRTKTTVVTDETLPREDDRPVQVTTIPFQNEKGAWLIAKVHVDVSRQRRLERELAHAQKLESIGHLAAGIAHEINTPTQYIGDNIQFLQDAFGSIDVLLKHLARLLQAAKEDAVPQPLLAEVEASIREADLDYLAAEIPKAIHASLDGVDRVATIVRAMKEFSHPGGEQKRAVDLNRAVQSTLTVSRNEWKYVAGLVTDFDPHLPMVHCYPSDLNQAVLNVLINAGQAIAEVVGRGAQDAGTITVCTRRDGDWAEIRIGDTGPGIPEPIRSRIFDPFFTTKDVGKGTGQGLAIAYDIIVKKHQGTIHFETEVGAGTTFILRLPLTAITQESEDAHDQAECVAG